MKSPILVMLMLSVASCQKEVQERKDVTETSIEYNVNKKAMLGLLNEVRAKGCRCGVTQMAAVAPLAWNDTLAYTAYLHSTDMTAKGYFSHTGSDGSTVAVRVSRQGYPWSLLGENLAKGDPTESSVVEGWLKSEPHCKNIMDPSFSNVGAGMHQNTWTQVFARRR